MARRNTTKQPVLNRSAIRTLQEKGLRRKGGLRKIGEWKRVENQKTSDQTRHELGVKLWVVRSDDRKGDFEKRVRDMNNVGRKVK